MIGRRWKVAAVGTALVAGTLFALPASSNATTLTARTILVNTSGVNVGTVRFFAASDGTVTGKATVNLPTDSAQFHGMHIHWNNDPANGEGCVVGDPANPFLAVDGHYNPTAAIHGNHLGDLPSLVRRSDGVATITFSLDKFAPGDLVGKAVIVHAGADNFANVPIGPAPNQYTDNGTAYAGTSATGNAGLRYACGVIASATS
jgi:Cu-Zn family superoxide dismutase